MPNIPNFLAWILDLFPSVLPHLPTLSSLYSLRFTRRLIFHVRRSPCLAILEIRRRIDIYIYYTFISHRFEINQDGQKRQGLQEGVQEGV